MLLPCFRHIHHQGPRFYALGRPLHSSSSPSSFPFAFLREFYFQAYSLDRSGRASLALAATAASDDEVATLVVKKSKNQKKREAQRAVDWAIEFSTFSDSQLRRAMRWGDLKEDIYEAVKVVKKIGRDGKHARRRQLNLISGMLRGTNPELMEAIIKAIKDGDVHGLFNKSNDADEDESEYSSTDEESTDEDYVNDTVERWFDGLLSGDSDVLAEIYSIRSADFDRQELRQLLREATKSLKKENEENDSEDDQDASASGNVGESKAKLRDYLRYLVQISSG